MPRYVLRLRVRAKEPITREHLHAFDSSRRDVTVRKLGPDEVTVAVTYKTGDPVSALSWAASFVLDRIPGEMVKVEATLSK